MKLTVDHNTKVMLDNKKYLLEKGDIIIEKKDGEEYPVHDKEHTQSAIGYIMKYQDKGGEIGAKAKRNKAKVARAAKKFGIDLPENW